MKRYLLFGGQDYYPSGGWEDFIQHDDEVLKLQNILYQGELGICLNHDMQAKFPFGIDWAHIIDSSNGEIISQLSYKKDESGAYVAFWDNSKMNQDPAPVPRIKV